VLFGVGNILDSTMVNIRCRQIFLALVQCSAAFGELALVHCLVAFGELALVLWLVALCWIALVLCLVALL
jgi:hypothetical protein